MARESLEDRLRRVQEEFARGLPARIAELVQTWDRDLPLEERMKLARHLSHRLAGGAGTLGQPEVGDAARALELDLQGMLDDGRVPDGESLAGLRARSADLLRAIRAAPPPP